MIREMRDEDLAAVVEVWRDSGLIRSYNDPAMDIAFARRADHSTVLVAEEAGEIVATAMVGDDGHRGWIYYVATTPEQRKQGFGKAIVAAAEQWLRDRGVWKAQLLIRHDNAAVMQFYEQLGYADTRSACFQKVIGTQAFP